MSRSALNVVVLALVGLCGCETPNTAYLDFNANYPVFLGPPLAIGGKPIAYADTHAPPYERESYRKFGAAGNSGRVSIDTVETVSVVKREWGRTGSGGAQGKHQFVAHTELYVSRWLALPGLIILPIVLARVYVGAEGRVAQLTKAPK